MNFVGEDSAQFRTPLGDYYNRCARHSGETGTLSKRMLCNGGESFAKPTVAKTAMSNPLDQSLFRLLKVTLSRLSQPENAHSSAKTKVSILRLAGDNSGAIRRKEETVFRRLLLPYRHDFFDRDLLKGRCIRKMLQRVYTVHTA